MKKTSILRNNINSVSIDCQWEIEPEKDKTERLKTLHNNAIQVIYLLD